MFNTIILAAEQIDKNWNGQSGKALFKINGKSMAEYIISAVRGAKDSNKILIIGDKKKLEEELSYKPDAYIQSAGSISQELNFAVAQLGNDLPIIVCTADIPMVTSAAINEFVDNAKLLNADICYPLIEKKLFNNKFPEIEADFLKIKDGSFTGGNIIYINSNVKKQGIDFVEKIFEFKKNPVKMAGLLGFSFMMEYSMGSITIEKIEKKFSNIANAKLMTVSSVHPEIAFNVDKPGDVIVATANLS